MTINPATGSIPCPACGQMARMDDSHTGKQIIICEACHCGYNIPVKNMPMMNLCLCGATPSPDIHIHNSGLQSQRMRRSWP